VDDEHDIVEAEQNVLERLGYQVITETTAEAALETFISHSARLDLVILDFALAEMTGLELAKQMKEYRDEVPIVMATGFSGAVDRSEIEAVGIKKLISKPLTSREVGETIRDILNDRGISIG
jgi:DNA-binding response OmpR family regulator